MLRSCWYAWAIALRFIGAASQEYGFSYKDVKNWDTWDKGHLDMCLHSAASFSASSQIMSCYRLRLNIEFLDLELYSERPALMRIPGFVGKSTVDGIRRTILTTENLWLDQENPFVMHIFKRFQRVFRLNPEMAEDFKILKYSVGENIRPHYDYLPGIGPYLGESDLELNALGNRIATALLMVQPAIKGGGTLFPYLKTVLLPAPGDLLLWLNTDSNSVREDRSAHAGCPVELGQKLAISLWFRRNFQDGIKCSTSHEGYAPLELLQRGETWKIPI